MQLMRAPPPTGTTSCGAGQKSAFGRGWKSAQAGMRAPSITSVRRVTARTPSTPVTSRRSSGE